MVRGHRCRMGCGRFTYIFVAGHDHSGAGFVPFWSFFSPRPLRRPLQAKTLRQDRSASRSPAWMPLAGWRSCCPPGGSVPPPRGAAGPGAGRRDAARLRGLLDGNGELRRTVSRLRRPAERSGRLKQMFRINFRLTHELNLR